jgi:hypothetical protein
MHIRKKGVVWLPISVFTAYLGYNTPFLIRPVPKGPKFRSSGHKMGLIRQIMRYVSQNVSKLSCPVIQHRTIFHRSAGTEALLSKLLLMTSSLQKIAQKSALPWHEENVIFSILLVLVLANGRTQELDPTNTTRTAA